MTTKYYQIGGFRPDARWFDDDWNNKKLIDMLAGPTSPIRPSADRPLELILGIKVVGTSHLLLADAQTREIGKRKPSRFTTVADYASLSPIYFTSADELEQKLNSLKPKAKKGKKGEARDTSQANKVYTSGEQGINRGEFEHGRVLYRLLQNTITPLIYSVPDTSWIQHIRIVSFTCNLRSMDGRDYEEKQRSPRPLEYGWAEAIPDPRLTFKQGSAVHIIRAEDRLLKVKRPQRAFEYGTTQTINTKQINPLAQQFFGALNDGTGPPTLLLVHNENLARRALRELEVETSKWKSGIGSLLRPERVTESRESSVGSSANIDYEQRKRRTRDRSQSPVRPSYRGPDGGLWRSRRTSSPSIEPRLAPVYVIDVQALYWTMMQSCNEKNIGDIAQKLGVLEDGNCWCAGNEAVYIFQLWHSMISGTAIDERRALMTNSGIRKTSLEPERKEQRSPTPENSDEEFDPNDIVQVSNSAQNPQDNAHDSETDYGSDY